MVIGPEPLTGQTALITGASQGIGRALAGRLHGVGMHVVITARSEAGLAEAAAELRESRAPGAVLAIPADVTDPAAVAALVETARTEFQTIDLVVNNAGRAEGTNQVLWEVDPDVWWQTVTTNLRGPMLVCRSAIPGMLAHGSGRIVNVNSIRGFRNTPTQTAYGVSKAALTRLTETLSEALAGTGVRIFDYSPGRVRTRLTEAMGHIALQPDRTWTPMEQALSGIVAIAEGRLDDLAGRFIHAHDDLADLVARADEVRASGARRSVLSGLDSSDHLLQR